MSTRLITVNPTLIQQLNPTLVAQSARATALKDAARPKVSVLGALGLAGLGLAGWIVYRARR